MRSFLFVPEKLGSTRDSELAAFHFCRMVEVRTPCHSAYAKSRFAGFGAAAPMLAH